MEQLIPYRFVVKVYPTENHPQSDSIGWTYAHAIVFDGEIDNATARLWLALKAAHWQVKGIESAGEMPPSQITEGGTAELDLYRRAVKQGFAVEYHANPKWKPDPGAFFD